MTLTVLLLLECRNLMIIAVFYALPVVQLVITYQEVWYILCGF